MARFQSSDRRDEARVRRVLSRRHFLEMALAASGSVAVASPGVGGAVRRAASVMPAGSDLGAIEHVIFLMQENRSFDHYFGVRAGVSGFDDHRVHRDGVFAQHAPSIPGGVLMPFHLDTSALAGFCVRDLNHGWKAQHSCWDGGSMTRFAETHMLPEYEGPEYGTLTMGFYRQRDIPYHDALAGAFTLCDGYHCSVLGPTHPNRLMSVSGTVDPDGRHGGPVLTTNSDPSRKFSIAWTTMPEVLEDAGVTWKVYNPPGPLYDVSSPLVLATSDSVLAYFKQYADPKTTLHQKAFGPTFPDDFRHDVRQGTLPAVSWLIPPIGHDEHPPAPSSLGASFIDSALRILLEDRSVWSKTVLFVMYDENDGFFDHVPPPTAPPGTSGEYVTVTPLPTTAEGLRGPVGLGMRVPMLVVSPFSRGGRIVSEVADHTSQLRFLEARFGVHAPNISSWRRGAVSDLTGTLRMGSPDTTSPRLPSTAGDTVVAARARGATEDDVLGATGPGQPVYPVPQPQSMPHQG